MTSTRSQNEATRFRSWLMKIEPHAALGHQVVHDRQHLHLHRDVERRGRLVGDQQIGAGDQHHRDHDALAHAAGDLVRIGVVDALRIADPHGLQHLERAARAPRARTRPRGPASASAIWPPTGITGFSENFGSCMTMAIRPPRICRIARSAGGQEVDALERERAAPSTSPGGGTRRRMARPVIDLPEPDSPTMPSFSRPTVEAHAAHRLDDAMRAREAHAEVLDREQRRHRSSLGLGVEHVAEPVAEQVEAEADDEDREPGHRRHPPLVEEEPPPEAIMAPHSASGGCAPRPRKPSPAAVRMMPAMSRRRARSPTRCTAARRGPARCGAARRPAGGPPR